jgi:hypothetical protein
MAMGERFRRNRSADDTGATSPSLTRLKHVAPVATVAIAFIALVVRLFLIVNRYAVDVFFGDHWAFEDSTLFEQHSWIEIFRWQHGPHRQGLGGLLLAAAEPLIHWDQRYVTFGMAALIAFACLAALWLKYRLFGNVGYFDVIIPLLFLTPVQYETLLGANNPAHGPLPLLLSVLYCLAWTIADRRRKYAAILLVNVLLIYTGFGLFMGCVTAILFGLDFYRSRARASAVALGIAIASIGSFFFGYRMDPAVACFSPYPRQPTDYLFFAAFLFSSFVKLYPARSTVVPAFLMGSILLLIFMGMVARVTLKISKERVATPRTIAPFALLWYSLIFCCAAAYGRTCLSLAPAPRYLTYLILAFFGLYLSALSAKLALIRNECLVGILLISLLSSGWISAEESRIMSLRHQQRRDWRACYLATHTIEACDAMSGSFIYNQPEPTDLRPKLDFLERRHLGLFR